MISYFRYTRATDKQQRQYLQWFQTFIGSGSVRWLQWQGQRVCIQQ